MANSWFEFKRFKIEQSGAAMKVGTDGTLLGAWARVRGDEERILDIGTGTGLIALMMAQRTEDITNSNGLSPQIDAIELDAEASLQATENFRLSPWSERLHIVNSSIQEFTHKTAIKNHSDTDSLGLYDHIISNPPYFINALGSPEQKRNLARHTDTLSHEELISSSASLMKDSGLFSVIIPTDSVTSFVATAQLSGLTLMRKCNIYSRPETKPIRSMLEFAFDDSCCFAPEQTSLTIEAGDRGDYTNEYRVLTKDFYLKF